jgi:hypothetical protein
MPFSQKKDTQRQKVLFSKRFALALEIAGVRLSPTIVQSEYNKRSGQPPITIHAARKWLIGEAIPTQDRIQILADWLNVTASWLRFGEDIHNTKTQDLTSQEWQLINGFRQLDAKQKVSVVSLILTIPRGRIRQK